MCGLVGVGVDGGGARLLLVQVQVLVSVVQREAWRGSPAACFV